MRCKAFQHNQPFGKLRSVIDSRGWGLLLAILWAGNVEMVPAAPSSTASEYLIESWQSDDGLPNNSVNSITQTKDGYLWLATFNGLVRFDGVRFVVFDSSTPGLSSPRPRLIRADDKGRLWVASGEGALTLHEHGLFRPVAQFEAVYSITQATEGEVWISSNRGLWWSKQGKLHPAEGELAGANKGLGWSDVDKNGVTWFQTAGNLYCRQKDGKVQLLPGMSGNGETIDAITPRGAGGVWIAQKSGYRYVLAEGQASELNAWPSQEQIGVYEMLEDKTGNLWVASNGKGLWRLGPDGDFERFSTENGLNHNEVRSVFEDYEGNVWVGTDGGGLHKFKRRFFAMIGKAAGLSGEIVYSIFAGRNGMMWIGTHGGGVYGLKQQGRDKPELIAINSPMHVWSVLEDRTGKLWAGSFGFGLAWLENGKVNATYEHFTNLPSTTYSVAMIEDSLGWHWIGGPHGLVRRQAGNFQGFGLEFGFPKADVRCLIEDNQGTIWIGAAEGLFSWKRETPELPKGEIKHYTTGDGLPSNKVWSLYDDRKGALWVGLSGGGLSRFQNGRFSNFEPRDGLHDKVISGIVEDANEQFWLTSPTGIFRVSRAQLEGFAAGRLSSISGVTYGKKDGLGSRECTGGSCPNIARTSDGRLWFSTFKGVAVVDPNNLLVNSKPPPVVIEQVTVDDRESVPIRNASKITISPGRRRLEVHYTGLSLAAPSQVKFKCQLEGLDSDWIHAGTQRSAIYNHLSPGSYVFRVIACNSDGVWNETGASIGILIKPFFWQTGWFRLLALLALAGGLGGLVRFLSLRRIRRKMELLEQALALKKERERIAQDMHDHLGSDLTRISLLSELTKKDLTFPDLASVHIERISATARNLAQGMDEIVWTLNPLKDQLKDLIAYFSAYAEEFLTMTTIRWRLELPSELPSVTLTSEKRHNLFLTLKEALHNAVKYSGGSEILFRVRCEPERLVLSLEDNGKGFEVEEAVLKGNGLTNMRNRLQAIGGALEIHASGRAGVRLHIILPHKASQP